MRAREGVEPRRRSVSHCSQCRDASAIPHQRYHATQPEGVHISEEYLTKHRDTRRHSKVTSPCLTMRGSAWENTLDP
ncbi:hypothetical protein J6590_039927 [Homalodisca vitripennis]|nr:hypothetical protein J6590_039927 [Homalodisca vitripennis]